MYTDALYQKIEAYIAKEMDANQKSSFEAEMQADPEIEELVNAHLTADKVISHSLNMDRKSQLKKIDIELDKELDATQPRSMAKRISMWRKIAVAASFILIASIAFHFGSQGANTPNALAEAYFVESNHQIRGEQTVKGPFELMTEAGDAFANERYTEAISLYDQVIDGKSLLFEQASFNKAMCLLSNDQVEDAIQILKTIQQDQDHQYQGNAKDILKKLRVK
jgi:hypothetical protein